MAIAYHDIVYNTLKKDNEEKSAAFAVEKLTMAGIPETVRQTCYQHIIATKTHQTSPRTDTNLFTDADLSILGAPPEVYVHYCRMIRKEYRYYPDLVYNPGRKKVLQHFLAMPAIYKSDHFAAKYEAQARRNIAMELADMGR